jgi:hypothetical protein
MEHLTSDQRVNSATPLSEEKDMNWNVWESSLDSIAQQAQCSRAPSDMSRASTKLPVGLFID